MKIWTVAIVTVALLGSAMAQLNVIRPNHFLPKGFFANENKVSHLVPDSFYGGLTLEQDSPQQRQQRQQQQKQQPSSAPLLTPENNQAPAPAAASATGSGEVTEAGQPAGTPDSYSNIGGGNPRGDSGVGNEYGERVPELGDHGYASFSYH